MELSPLRARSATSSIFSNLAPDDFLIGNIQIIFSTSSSLRKRYIKYRSLLHYINSMIYCTTS